jgi:predicted N-acetyltransferase YhbS
MYAAFGLFLQYVMNEKYHIQTVTQNDIPVITRLVNSAYQGEPGSKSWTSEGHIVAGQRTTEDIVRNLLQQPAITMLKCTDEHQTIVGCVLLEKKENTLYLGMLSVDPHMQAAGIGKLLLQHGELFARDHHYDTVTITVINMRHELIDWYKRKGFRSTGNSQPFSNQSSKALANFSFMEMKKEL